MNYEITVVIPVYNQLSRLKLTIQGFLNNEKFESIQIIVVDDGSTEDISDYIYSLGKHNIRCIVNTENKGRAFARNIGAKEASSDKLVFCDADRIPGSNFIEEHLKKIQRGVVTVGVLKEVYFTEIEKNKDKIFEIVKSDGRFSRETQYSKIINVLFDENQISNSPISWFCTMSANLGITKFDFSKVGGFDENFTDWGFEHFELGYRLIQNGVTFNRILGAKNYHLAHKREKNFYITAIENSYCYFYDKHPYYDVSLLDKFHKGIISLEKYSDLVEGSNRLQSKYKDNQHFIKIFNL
ncbi:TPA: glycosyltransferase family 2 protein [Streptococcus pneumoniae]